MKFVMVAAALLLCSGCSASPAAQDAGAEPEVPAEVSANEEACSQFAEATSRIADPFQQDKPEEPWTELRGDFDMIALSAEGDVKVRIASLVDQWPDFVDILLRDGKPKMNELIEAAGRACTADGFDANYSTFQG